VRLRCASWRQLEAIYRRDLSRSAFFLKSSKPPPIGARLKIQLSLPSNTVISLAGAVSEHVPMGGMGGRGPGVDIQLDPVPQSVMWLIENALSSVGKENSVMRPIPKESKSQAERAKVQPEAERSLDEGKDLVEAEDDLVTALKEELLSFQRLNPFQILGVGYSADDNAVRAAFGALTKRYHPDRYARYQSEEAKSLASEVFILIRNAYRMLVDQASRDGVKLAVREGRPHRTKPLVRPKPAGKALDIPVVTTINKPPVEVRMPVVPPPPPAEPVNPVAAALVDDGSEFADPQPTTGATPVDVGQPDGATPEPTTTDQRFVRAESLLDEGKYNEAQAVYFIAIRKNPKNGPARAGLEVVEALKALAQGDRMEAAERLEAALEFDPDNARAAAEIANMRQAATKQRKSHLQKLLTRKKEV
jgi:tetratricopeptide (TPR) repeat protein